MQQTNIEVRGGFEVRETKFYVPSDSVNLDSQTKRTITICNLFLNHRLEVSDIARLLDEDEGNVVSTLLKRGVIMERRNHKGNPPEGIERRTYRPRPLLANDRRRTS